MNTGKTLFAQLMDFLPWTTFTRIVDRYGGDHRVRTLSCAEQYRSMAFAQLTYRESLRDIETCLSVHASKLYHMGFRQPVRRSTLADANERRDWRIHAALAQRLITQARTLYVDEELGLDLTNTVYALDSTTIALCLSVFPWAHFRTAKAAVKMHTLLDLRGNIPSFIHISDGKLHDVHALDMLLPEAGAIYVVDRGYVDFARLYQPVDEVFPGRSRHGLILWCPGLKGGSLMAMGQQKDRQGDLMVSWSEMPRSPGHVFYDRLQLVLIEGGFDGFAEAVCQPYYAARMGAPSVPPGRYFRMHLVGYFEGIDSERGLEWRCSDSLSLREFLLLEMRERVPDHSWLSRTRARLPHEVHTAVFDWVLALIAEAGLVKGERIGVDASTMEANAALRNIVRRDTGEGYRGMLERLAQESGIETPTAEDLARLDRKRKGKKLSNQDWVSRSDPEAKIAKMKDGTTHLAYKPEHAVDLDTGAVVAAELHPADEGDTTTLPKTLAAAEANLEAVDVAPTAEDPAECVTDKGYHSRLVLKALDDGPWKSRISEPKQKGFARWHGDDAARRAVTNNRTRLLSGVAREAFKLRAEIVERSFAHNLDRGGMRRTWLRGRENVHKRYLLHVAGHNLSLLMRQLIGAGTPKEAVAGGIGALFVLVTPAGAVLVVQIVLIVSEDGETAFAAICFAVA